MFDDKTRLKAVVLYKMTGNKSVTAQNLGIDVSTLTRWMKDDWWKDYEEEVRLQSRSELSTSLQNVVNKALNAVNDRLDGGDYIFDQKTGEIKRKPINAHVANKILNDAITNTQVIEKLAQEDKRHQSQEKITDTLLKLATEFEKFSKMRLIDAEKEKDAVHVEGKEGLQEGTGLGASAPGADEATGSPARSPSARDEERTGTQG